MRRQFLRSALALSFAAAAAGASGQDLTPVSIAWGAFPDAPQIAVASDRKLWAAERIDARIIPTASGRAGFEALVSGQADYAVMTEFPAVLGVMRGQRFAIVAVLSQFKALRVITRGSKAVDLKSLAGKKVAVPVGTNVHFVIADALDKAGVRAEFINVPPPEMAAALVRGEVDAMMPFPSGYANARKVLGAQYQELRLPDHMSSLVLAASEKAAANQALTRRVLTALLKAEDVVAKAPAEAQEATARFVGTTTTLDAVQAAWPEYEFRIKLDAGTLDLMAREGRWLEAHGLVKEGDATAAQYRRVFAPEVLRGLDGKRVTLAN